MLDNLVLCRVQELPGGVIQKRKRIKQAIDKVVFGTNREIFMRYLDTSITSYN